MSPFRLAPFQGHFWRLAGFLLMAWGFAADQVRAQEPVVPDAAARRMAAMEFHLANQQRAGVLVPLYVYPSDIHTNEVFNRLIAIKRRFETVPIWVIVNPASGPGKQVDANYTKAIDRLQGAGCVTIGYVSTSYAKRAASAVISDMDVWLAMYPRIQGFFFDEMIYEDNDAGVKHQAGLYQYAKSRGCWPIVANPGTDTPGRYFSTKVADVIVVHEGSEWPEMAKLQGDYFGGYADFPPSTRSVLVHSQPELDVKALDKSRYYARWFYVTDKPYRPNDPTAPNPWDTLSKHMEALCKELANHP